MATLDLQHLHKAYSPEVVPVQDLSLQVGDNEFLTLVGPSGCGKSTLLRLIAGLEPPTSGRILLDGQDIGPLPPGQRNIAMVFQSYALYPHMSVAANLASGLKLRGVPPGEIQQRVQETAARLGLEDLLQRRPAQLSGGQRQRVALGRALVRDPQVFLLDEPLSNLDALLREQVRADLKQIFQRQRAPVVYVTHDQTEALTLATQVAVLHQGRLQQIDSPHAIYHRPANRFVASFVGSPQMNLLPLPCRRGAVVLGGLELAIPEGEETIVLGIRPEQVHLAGPNDEAGVTGQVELVENLGMNDLVTVRLGDAGPLLRCLLPSVPERASTISLALPVQSLHWFDGTTGQRLGEYPTRSASA